MKKLLNFFRKFSKKTDINEVIEKELKENIEVIKSLREYDEGKKDISTNNIQKHLPNVRITP